MNTLIIRQANINDAYFIAQIATNDLGYPCTKQLVQQRLEQSNPAKERIFVALSEDAVIGFIQTEIYQLLYQPDIVNILGLAVSKQYRNKGAGRLLVEAAENWAKSLQISKIRVNSSSKRLNAHQFYQHLGFTNTKEQKRFVKEI